MIFSGRDPEYKIVNGKKKYKKKYNSTEFSFNEQRHVTLAEDMVSCHCFTYIMLLTLIIIKCTHLLSTKLLLPSENFGRKKENQAKVTLKCYEKKYS